jgi:hypothetical protein
MVVSELGNSFVPSHMLRYHEMSGPFLCVGHGRVPDVVRYCHLDAVDGIICYALK